MSDYYSLLRELPAVDRLMREPQLSELLASIPRRLVLEAVQDTVNDYRELISANRDHSERLAAINLQVDRLAAQAGALAVSKADANFKRVINATGIIIHTNLGRAPLAKRAVNAIKEIASGYSNLELDLQSGKRGSRQEHLEELLCSISGAEAALTVNNNAAAVFLVLRDLAANAEVVVSRGQLVEIGGSFRIPDIMAASGAKLVEVGTTNKTYLRDYERVINENSAALLKVHTSNYHLLGFTATVETAQLAALAHKHNLVLIEDLGSGVFLELEKYGLPAEPRVQDSLAAGADLVTFSGDKMLGGPQCGIIVGRKDLIASVRSNQLARTLRIDKFTIAALEATLRLYLDENLAITEIPVWQMLTAKLEVLGQRAEKLAAGFRKIFKADQVSVIEGYSLVGGGALPTAELPTALIAVKLPAESGSALAGLLRQGKPPVILRLQQDLLLFDVRTIFAEEETELLESLAETAGRLEGK